MPTGKQYAKESYIYMEGDRAEDIYVLRNGAVTLSYLSPDYGNEVNENLKPGEFFGVRPVLGGFLREENAMAMSEVEVIRFTKNEFIEFMSQRPDVVIKMLRSFSDRLRHLGKLENKLLSKAGMVQDQPSIRLFQVGEFYLKARKFTQAEYVFRQYVNNFPSGVLVDRALERLRFTAKGISQGIPEISFDLLEENPNAGEGDPKKLLAGVQSSAGRSEAKQSSGENVDTSNLDRRLVQAMDLMGQKKYDDMLKVLADVLADPQTQEVPSAEEQTLFLIGKANYLKSDFKNAVKSLTDFYSKYPQSDNLREFLLMTGASYLKLDEGAKGRMFLEKLTSGGEDDRIAVQAKKILEEA